MPTARRWSTRLVVAALFALGLVLGLQKIRDFDYWWHARTGELILETGTVPRADAFTYSVPGNRWVDIHWLFQVGLAEVRALGGTAGVVVAKAVCVAALTALLLGVGLRRGGIALSALAVGLGLLVAGDRFMPRPELPSFVLLAAVLLLVDRHERRGGRGILWAVPLQLLWANVHGLFAVGLAVLAIALAAEALRPLVVPGAALRRDRLGPLAAALVLSAAVSLVNPNGVDGLLYPVQQLQMVGPEGQRGLFGSVIAELQPPFSPDLPMSAFARSLFLATAALSLGAMAGNWRRVSAFDPLAWTAFGWLALGANRNVALFAIVATAITARNGNALLARRPLRPGLAVAANLVVATALAVAAVDVARDRFFERMGTPRETGIGTFDFYYPEAAVDWIARERPPGPIAHYMADGGYLIDRLWPAYRVLADGRLEVFGADTFARLSYTGSDAFRALDQEYHFGVVLVHYSLVDSRELLYWLYLNPSWRMVQVDDTAALFVRVGPGGARWPAVDPDAPDLFPPLPDVRTPSDRLRRMARVHFYAALHRWRPALAGWEDAIARYPDLPQAGVVHAWLLRQNGLFAAAETVLRQELAERPADPALLVQLADLRAAAGDAAGAGALYDRALALDPNAPYALLHRAELAESAGDAVLAQQLRARLAALSPSASTLEANAGYGIHWK
jgi:hypothetical protein